MSRIAFAAAFGVLALMGCQSTENKEEHACATCKTLREKSPNPKDTTEWKRHKCSCPGCTDCKEGRPCGACKA